MSAHLLRLVPDGFRDKVRRVRCELDFYIELVRLAKKHNVLVMSDFAYADICFDGYKAPSFLEAPGALDVGVEFTTMSKGYSMAGWRIGFCSGNAEMVRALATIKGTVAFSTSSFPY